MWSRNGRMRQTLLHDPSPFLPAGPIQLSLYRLCRYRDFGSKTGNKAALRDESRSLSDISCSIRLLDTYIYICSITCSLSCRSPPSYTLDWLLCAVCHLHTSRTRRRRRRHWATSRRARYVIVGDNTLHRSYIHRRRYTQNVVTHLKMISVYIDTDDSGHF